MRLDGLAASPPVAGPTSEGRERATRLIGVPGQGVPKWNVSDIRVGNIAGGQK